MAEHLDVEVEETGPVAPNAPSDSTETVEASTEEEGAFHVPDKFMNEDGSVNVESLAKSYSELEKSTSSPPPSDKIGTDSQPNVLEVTDEEMHQWGTEIAENGGLAEDSYKTLEERGVPRKLADIYVAGQQSIVAQTRSQLVDPIGGEEAYAEMIEWARTNLSEPEISAYDKIMMEGDLTQKALVVQGLSARYSKDNPTAPSLIQGEAGPSNVSSSYESWDQVKQAMRDPRYQSDPAYRNKVTQRLDVSNNL